MGGLFLGRSPLDGGRNEGSTGEIESFRCADVEDRAGTHEGVASPGYKVGEEVALKRGLDGLRNGGEDLPAEEVQARIDVTGGLGFHLFLEARDPLVCVHDHGAIVLGVPGMGRPPSTEPRPWPDETGQRPPGPPGRTNRRWQQERDRSGGTALRS